LEERKQEGRAKRSRQRRKMEEEKEVRCPSFF